jgi:hypothetical protein
MLDYLENLSNCIAEENIKGYLLELRMNQTRGSAICETSKSCESINIHPEMLV